MSKCQTFQTFHIKMSFICLKVKIDFYTIDVTLTLFLRKRQKVNAEMPYLETNTRK